MRIVVTGATGNVGVSVLRALAGEDVVAVARRAPSGPLPGGARYVRADVVRDDLAAIFAGADAVIHLAWLIQPARDRARTRAVNVGGSRRVFEAAARAGVGTLVHASSVGAYSPGPKDRAVDESWPTQGIASSFYATDKAQVERILDAVEARHRGLRVVRLRPGLIFQAQAAREIQAYFAGPLLPRRLLRRGLIPVVPRVPRLVFQAVHADDVAEAYRLAVTRDVRGAFNVAADPVFDAGELARVFGARTVPVDPRLLRALAALSFRARLQPTEPGWLDMALAVPVMDTARARAKLGWTPRHRADDTLLELVDAIRRGEGAAQPPLTG